MTSSKIPQPDYWLEIRKEYIIENFEKLLYYIRRYQYNGEKDSGNGEFLNTCRYLVDLADELSEYSLSRTFISSPEFKLSGSDMVVSDVLAYRIIVAAIIASQKIGEDKHLIIRRLLNLLVVAQKMPHTDIADDLIYVTTNCIRKSPIVNLGLKWDDIDNPETFSPIRVLHNLSRTKFDVSGGKEALYEGKGTVVFTDDEVLAAPVNKTDFLKGNLTEYLSIGKSIKVLLPKSDHMKSPETVEDIAEGMTFMTRAQGGVKTSVVETKRKYAAHSIVPVKIKSSYGVKVEAETINKEYDKISGKININLSDCLRYADIFQVLSFFSPGRRLYVEYTPDDREFSFELKGGFNQFYNEYANQMRGESLPGVYIGDYSAGTQWLTEDGFVVNVMGKVTKEEILEAMEQKIPLTIRINSPKAIPGTILINGSIVDDIDIYGLDEPIVDMEAYQHECFIYIFSQFIKYCEESIPISSTDSRINEIDHSGVMEISNILMSHQRLLSDTMPRLLCLQTALMLSIAAGDYTLSAYIRHELEYHIAVARFAAGASPMSISLSHGPILDGIPEVEKHERIIAMIRNYKEPEIDHSSERITTDETIEDTVDGLIDASNRLIGKIDDREISRIKLELARTLDVDDQFRSPDLTTYYGVESDTLEFKTSAVCPPKNKLKGSAEYEPETQKWAILKTICGFLNSTTGGELLIGVRDNGVASGIAHDYNLLYEDRRIPEPNADRYRTYL
ncbi:MAG: ATP-binding protein [Muribaculaceae bacterium]|nr:ATP-binding protein [Muribaculaceae bacterium]